MTAAFFGEQTEPSTVKATIVQKYFDAWSKIILPMAQRYHGGKIAYVDFYAGPGRYRDGAASTPLLVIEKALETPSVAAALVTMLMTKTRTTRRHWQPKLPTSQVLNVWHINRPSTKTSLVKTQPTTLEKREEFQHSHSSIPLGICFVGPVRRSVHGRSKCAAHSTT